MIDALFPLGMQHYIIGGTFVALGIAIPFILTGLVAGVSTFFTAIWSYVHPGWFFQKEGYVRSRTWRIALTLGIITGGFFYLVFFLEGVPVFTEIHPLRLFVGGLCIAIGARMSGGCTSGHGICGIAARERVSVVATVIFLTVAIVVAHVTSILFSL